MGKARQTGTPDQPEQHRNDTRLADYPDRSTVLHMPDRHTCKPVLRPKPRRERTDAPSANSSMRPTVKFCEWIVFLALVRLVDLRSIHWRCTKR